MGLIYVATAAVVVASTVLGQAVHVLCGSRRWLPSSPAVGFALLLILGGTLVGRPGRGVTVGAVVLALVVGSLLARPVRAALRQALPEALVLAAGVGLLASLPFLVSGRPGILGTGDDNDLVAHLTALYWLTTHHGAEPGLLVSGYPVGNHGVVAALVQGLRIPPVPAFDGLILALPVLIALTALAGLSERPRAGRWLVAALVGLCYLAASYLVQGSFKELVEGLLVLAFALELRRLLRRAPDVGGEHGRSSRRARLLAGVPLGLLAGATVYDYSYLGLAWPLGAAAVLAAVELVARRGWLRPRARAVLLALPTALGAAAVCLLAVAPDLHRLSVFRHSSFNHEALSGTGNLVDKIPKVQALGVWLTSDFRYSPRHDVLTEVLTGFAALALAAGLAWWLRRRDLAVAAALTASVILYWQATLHKNVYNQAKGLAILAPLVALLLGGALLEAWRPRGVRLRELTARRLALSTTSRLAAARVLGLIVLAGTGASSFLALRDGPVGSPADRAQLARLRPLLHGQPTLFVGNDDFSNWDLRGVPVSKPALLYADQIVPIRAEKPWSPSHPFDFDSFSAQTLDSVRYVITPDGAFQSSAPANFHLVGRSERYLVWRRRGHTPTRYTIEPKGRPWARMDCTSAPGDVVHLLPGVAGVLPKPIVRDIGAWRGQPIAAGDRAHVRLRVPAGTWDVSLQYVSYTGLRVRAPGLSTTLAPNQGRMGPYFGIGTLRLDRTATVKLRVRALPMPLLGRLLGAPGATRALNGFSQLPLAHVALTRHGARPRLVPLSRACGRYVDWFRLRRDGG